MIHDSIFDEFSRSKVVCGSAEILRALKAIDFTSLKVFEFGWLINEFFDERRADFDAAFREGAENHGEGLLRLPFPKSVFTWAEKVDDYPGATKKLVAFAEEEPGTNCINLLLAFRTQGIAGQSDRWLMVPGGASLCPPNYQHAPGVNNYTYDSSKQSCTIYMPNDSGYEFASVLEQLSHTAGNVTGIATLLARPNATIMSEEISKGSNFLRRQRGFKPLPTLHRVLHLSKEPVVRKQPAATREKVEVRPHDRRSHHRKLPNGRTIVVRSCKIKGGAGGFTMYEVAP